MVTVKKKSNRQFCSMLRVEKRTRGGWEGEGALRRQSQERRSTQSAEVAAFAGGVSYGGDCQVWGRGGVICMRG